MDFDQPLKPETLCYDSLVHLEPKKSSKDAYPLLQRVLHCPGI